MSDTPADVIGFYSTQLGVDEAAAESVLASALGRGGSFAELYFEHKRSGSLSFEDQQVKSTQASLSQGVGIRVVEGDAIGYAYTEDLSLDAMRSAAATAAQIAHGGSGIDPVDVTADSYPADRYSIASPSTSTPLADKVELLRRADDAARAYHSSIARVDASMVDEEKRVLIVRSDGGWSRTTSRCSDSMCPACRRLTENAAMRAGAAAAGWECPTSTITRLNRLPRKLRGRRSCNRRRGRRRPVRSRSYSPPAIPASSCTRPSATDSKPTSTARRRRTTPTGSANRLRQSSSP